MSELMKAALAHAAAGRPVFPCVNAPNTDKHKRPLTEHGFKDATTDPDKIRAWWSRHPDALIGMPTGGKYSGLDVVDLDKKKGKDGFAHVQDWETLSPVIALTQSGGAHLYYASSGMGVASTADKIASGVDTRGQNAYVILPPSPGYRWRDKSLDDVEQLPPVPLRLRPGEKEVMELPPLPQWFIDVCERDAGQGVAVLPKADLELVRAALAVIPADCGYDDWYHVAAGLHNELGDEDGLPLFLEWSARGGDKYDGEVACREKWNECRGLSTIGIGSVFHLANQASEDWRPEVAVPEPTRQAATDVDLRWPDDAPRDDETTGVLVKGRLPLVGAGLISGQWSTGKTALAIDLGHALGCRETWAGGKVTERCGTLIIAAESPGQIPPRLLALEGDPADLPVVYTRECPPRLLTRKAEASPVAAERLVTIVQAAAVAMRERHDLRLGVVIIDTLARVAGWQNENDASQCQRVMHMLDDLSKATGTLVLALDHMGKDVGRGTRGGSPKEDYSDVVLQLLGRDEGDRQMLVQKLRDGERDITVEYDIVSQVIGRDDDGDPITSCYVRWGDEVSAEERKKKRQKPGGGDLLLASLIEKLGGLPVDQRKLREAFFEAYPKGKNKPLSEATVRSAWSRAISVAGLVEMAGEDRQLMLHLGI